MSQHVAVGGSSASNLEVGPEPSRPSDEKSSIEELLPLPFVLERRLVSRPRLCVVIPVFNEEAVLPRTYTCVAEALDRLEAEWRILFVNDGSRDGTAGVLEDLYRRDARVDYLLLSRNFGHQAALTAGLDYADGHCIVSMDADLQHPPALLETLLAAWRMGYDVVHTRKLGTVGLPRWRLSLTALAYRLVSHISQLAIIPQASDYRLLDAEVLRAVRALPETGRLYRGLTPWVGYRQCVVPYIAPARAAGVSQYGVKQLLQLFMRALFDFSNVPLHAGLVLGGIAVGLSTIYLLFILLWILLGESTPSGWASTVSVTLLLNSITLAFLGIIGVYVARIYEEVRRRPTYILSRAREHEKPQGNA